jgi:predicted nucleotidyltransferase
MKMKPSEAMRIHRATIRRVVEAHRAGNVRVFGSVAHGVDTDGSDLDILVDPTPETTLFDIGAIRHELHTLLGVPVEVLTPMALPDRDKDVFLQGEMVPDAVICNLEIIGEASRNIARHYPEFPTAH